jgi:hypothetical protein
LLASNASAQAGNYPPGDATPLSTVQVTAPIQGYNIASAETDAVSGAYALSNGWRLKVEPTYDGIVARIDRQRAMHLIALSPDKFVSRDGNVSMEFNRGADRDEMQMSYVDPRLAQVVVVTSTLAQR